MYTYSMSAGENGDHGVNPQTKKKNPTVSGAGPTDAALVIAARAGELWACQTLFLRYTGLVEGLTTRLLGSDRDVEDLVQDSFVAVLTSLSRLKNPQAFESYLASITVRTVYSHLRRKRLAARLRWVPMEASDIEELVAPDAPLEVVMELKAVFELVEELPPLERVVLVLKRVEGYTLDEIVAFVGKSRATVKRKLVKAEQRLVQATQR